MSDPAHGRRYRLIDGRKRQAEFPESFAVPSLDDVARLRKGDLVKVGVEFEADEAGHGGERFWVILTGVFDEASPTCLSGDIDNDLACTASHGLGLGDRIDFDPQHVLAIAAGGDGR